jgi:thiol-disulfide isomerase/thioredoxin
MTTRKPLATLGWTVALLCGAAASSSGPNDSKDEAPTAEAVLRRTADYFKRVKSFAVEVEREQKLGSMSMKHALEVVNERPNRLAIRNKGNRPGIDVFSDGKTLSISIPAVKKYTQGKAPASLSDLSDDAMTRGILVGTLQGTMLLELTAADPYKMLMEGVKTSTYIGEEILDGVKAHHLKCTQDQFDWDVWVAAEGDPLLRKIVLDMTKSIANTPAAAQLKGQRLELIQTFKGWKVDAAVDEKTFAFRPPPGSQKVDSFIEAVAGGGREARSPLVGKPAPDLSLKLLNTGEFRLKDHREKDILMLDFWATWCGPCVQELPLLAEVAESYKDKGVAFFAINVRETPEQITKFQADKKLKFTVALDTDGSAGTAYGANAIPMLVLVDKKGVVQAVHVGYNPAIKTTLAKELDALLAGKDLAKEAVDQAKAPAPKNEGLERVWSVSGRYLSVATGPKGRSIYAVDARGHCDVLDLNGKTTRTFPIAVGGRAITARVARQAGGSEGFLVFGPWGPSVAALKGDGTKLWEEVGGQGVDDVWAADLDGDGADEAIVGYNGATGLHVFSPEGKRLWKRTDLGNVWNVTAGDLDGDGKLEVVTTSAGGKVYRFAAKDGTPLTTLEPGIYATKVRIASGRAEPPSKGDLLLVVGSEQQGETIVALGGDGKVLWTTKLPASPASCQSLAISPDGTRAAMGFQGGRVCVVDVGHGRIVGQVADQGFVPAVAWAVRGDGLDDLLLVSDGFSVHAFRVKPTAASPGNDRP